MKRYISRLFSICILSISMTAASAMTIYDEGVSGDIFSFLSSTAPFLGTLGEGSHNIIGSLDAGLTGDQVLNDGPDEFDVFRFTTTSAWSFTEVSTSGTTLVASLYDSIDTPFNLIFLDTALNGDFFGVRPAGNYTIGLLPFANTGTNSYEVAINVSAVPIPAALPLLLSGLTGLFVIRRRRTVT